MTGWQKKSYQLEQWSQTYVNIKITSMKLSFVNDFITCFACTGLMAFTVRYFHILSWASQGRLTTLFSWKQTDCPGNISSCAVQMSPKSRLFLFSCMFMLAFCPVVSFVDRYQWQPLTFATILFFFFFFFFVLSEDVDIDQNTV